MEKPFPGMDPYLEAPSIWPDVQHSLIVAMSNQINQCLSADYVTVISPYIAAEEIDFSGVHTIHRSCANAVSKREGHATEVTVAPLEIGDLTKVPTRYARLELRSVDGDVLITSIELLSPANKRPGADGADAYQQKRQEVFNSTAHLVEIDLLRDGQRSSFIDPLPDAAYFFFAAVRMNGRTPTSGRFSYTTRSHQLVTRCVDLILMCRLIWARRYAKYMPTLTTNAGSTTGMHHLHLN